MGGKSQNFNNNHTRILIVDDHPLIHQALKQLINQDPKLEVCGIADNVQDALISIESLRPDMAIVDLFLKKGSSGMELIRDIKSRYPMVLILVISMLDESLYAERVLRAGAKGYIMKEETTEKVITAIYRILKGEYYLSEAVSLKLLNRFFYNKTQKSDSPTDILTDRELEVLRLLGEGFGTSQIANNLNVSMKTIDTYRAHIKSKLNIKNTSKLVQYAVRWVFSDIRLQSQFDP